MQLQVIGGGARRRSRAQQAALCRGGVPELGGLLWERLIRPCRCARLLYTRCTTNTIYAVVYSDSTILHEEGTVLLNLHAPSQTDLDFSMAHADVQT